MFWRQSKMLQTIKLAISSNGNVYISFFSFCLDFYVTLFLIFCFIWIISLNKIYHYHIEVWSLCIYFC